jgi:3-carboxy-cis,cis-muconate cycloisomerase
VPTTFGLKAAGWLGGVVRSWRAWSAAFDRTQMLQLGGAGGTLASLGASGIMVEQALADELGLEVPDAPWHAQRDRLAGFVAAAGVYVGALGKIASDVALLMQAEVAEAFEAGGGSSTMPHKRNPAKCAAVLACSHRMPGLVATMLSAMVQEHERAVGGWQSEGATLVDAVQTSAAAVSALADAIESLTIDEARMRRNIEATRGAIFAERLALHLAPHVGRERSSALAKAAAEESARSGRPMVAVVAEMPDVTRWLDAQESADLFDPAQYLGSADAFRARLLFQAAVPGSKKH